MEESNQETLEMKNRKQEDLVMSETIEIIYKQKIGSPTFCRWKKFRYELLRRERKVFESSRADYGNDHLLWHIDDEPVFENHVRGASC